MPTTPRMRWPYPAEGQDPFTDSFNSMVNAMDTSFFAQIEDSNVLIMKGGSVSFVASTGVLSWSSAMELNSAVTGFKWSIPAGSIVLNDGEYLYATLAHNPITNTVVSVTKASKLPSTDPDNPLVLGLRNGDRVYFRDGKVLTDGQALLLFSTMPFGRESVTLAIMDQNNTGTPKVMGSYVLDPDDYALGSATKVFTLVATANVDVGTVTGEIVLYNVTGALTAATITLVGITAPTKFTATATIAATASLYEVRGRVTAGTGTLYVNWAGLWIDNNV